VVSVAVLPDYRIQVRFRDGLEGTVAMKDFILSSGAGVFSALRDPGLFAQAQIVLGAVTWPGGLDLAPDAMYDEIRDHGAWKLAGRS
jgi:hypothetical protein